MSMRVLVHADSLRRDAAAAIVLCELLRRRGLRAITSGQLTTPFYLKHWRPDLLFHTSPYKIADYIRRGVIRLDARPKIHLLPQEGRVTGPEAMSMVYGSNMDVLGRAIDRYYLWNQANSDWLSSERAIPQDRLRVLGAYRLDLVKYGRAPDLKHRPPVIGFVGRFTSMNAHDHRSPGFYAIAKPTEPEGRAADAEMVRRQRLGLAFYGDIIKALVTGTDCRISVRPHHNESPRGDAYRWLKDRYGDRIEIDSSLSFYDWAVDKAVLVSVTSSTVAEAYLARTPILCIDRLAGLADQMPAQWQSLYESYGIDACPESMDELVSTIGRIIENFEPARRSAYMDDMLARDSMWPVEGSYLATIAEDIAASLDGTGKAATARGIPGAAVFGHGWYLAKVLDETVRKRRRARLHYDYDGWIHGRPAYLRAVADRIVADRPWHIPEKRRAGPEPAPSTAAG